jgi:hypothetical protein
MVETGPAGYSYVWAAVSGQQMFCMQHHQMTTEFTFYTLLVAMIAGVQNT